MSSLSQQPYLLRALYEWCVDSGHTPYVTVRVDGNTRVPPGFVKDGHIVLNIGPSAVRNLQMGNEWLSFSARFGGMAHEIFVPVGNVLAIYARENGEGMAFPQSSTLPVEETEIGAEEAPQGQEEQPPSQPDKPKGRPNLRVVK